MNITPINSYSITYGSSLKIPKSNYVNQQEKIKNIQYLDLATVFEDFEKKFRETMETFVYMIKF